MSRFSRRAILTLSSGLVLAATAFGQAQPAKKEANAGFALKRPNEVVNGKNLMQWTEALKSRDPSVRERAIATLKAYGYYAQDQAPAVIRALRDTDASVRVNAAITLGFIGMEEKDRDAGVSGLIRLLTDRQGIAQYQAARALARLGSDANKAVPELTILTGNSTIWEVRQMALAALSAAAQIKNQDGTVGFDARAFRPLLHALNDHAAEVRLEAIYGLLRMGKPTQLANLRQEIAAVHPLLNPRQPDRVQIWSRVLIMGLEGVSEKYLGPIVHHLSSPDGETRIHAARALAFVGNGGKAHVRELREALNDKEPEVKAWACLALGEMKEAGQQAIPEIQRLTQDTNTTVQEAAKKALADLQSAPQPAAFDKPKLNSR